MAKEASSASKPKVAPPRPVSPYEDFEHFLENVFDRGWMRPLRWESPLWERAGAGEARVPRVDIIERDKEILVRAEIPGVDRKDLDVSVSDRTVTIKAQSRSESEEKAGDFYRREITCGAYARSVTLPGEVDADKASASFSDGMLELTLPRLKQARRRQIEVK